MAPNPVPSVAELEAIYRDANTVAVVGASADEAKAAHVIPDHLSSGARVLWIQPSTDTPQAIHLAQDTGLTVDTGQCMGATHAQLGLGLGPIAGPSADHQPGGTSDSIG
jgi:predicted CoA-binding protein